MAGTCECGNELLDSIKCGQFLEWLRTSQLLKKGSAPYSKKVSKCVKREMYENKHCKV